MADATKPGRFSVTFFATQSKFAEIMCESNSPYAVKSDLATIQPLEKDRFCRQNVGYSVGTPGLPAVFISPLQGSRDRHPIMEASVMHEFGHSFGLGDTYNALGVTYSGNMPDNLMKYSGGVELYPDDKAGLETAIAYSTRKGISCKGKQLEGTAGYLFCVPSKEFIETLRNTHAKVEELNPNRTTQAVASPSPSSPTSVPQIIGDNTIPTAIPTTGPSAVSQNETSYKAKIKFNQKTWLKSDPKAKPGKMLWFFYQKLLEVDAFDSTVRRDILAYMELCAYIIF
jgi:hypothetical protein